MEGTVRKEDYISPDVKGSRSQKQMQMILVNKSRPTKSGKTPNVPLTPRASGAGGISASYLHYTLHLC